MRRSRLTSPLRYRLWLTGHWLRQIFLPAAWRTGSNAWRQVGMALVVIGVAVPGSYYLFSADSRMQAIAAVQADGGSIARGDETGSAADDGGEQESAVEHAEKHMDPNYVCPMHPEIVTDDPEATCPICGMDLVPLEMGGEADVVQLSPTIINALGVRTERAQRRTLYRSIDSVGYVDYNEDKLRTVTLRTEGWVEHLAVKSAGERVKQGDLLFEIYSPTLVNAQDEYLQALELDNGEGSLVEASRARLVSLGVSQRQIEELHQSRKVSQTVAVYAPQDGIITELNVREGQFVPQSKSLVGLADLSSVWLIADIFESQADSLKPGLMADATLPFSPGNTWSGTVDYVYPTLDPKTRSLRVRLRFDNAEEALKPNMYANVTIYTDPARDALTIPREAVIHTGTQQRVILAMGDGKFKPVTVRTGAETDDRVVITNGLQPGDEVVVSSQFLIDSESSMRAALLRMGDS